MDIGIVYHIESPQQFWSELSDILSLPKDATLHTLDANLRNFITFCATYHERYLSTLAQLDHCCNLLLDSEFFTFHSERSCDTLLDDARTNTDPHLLFILYNVFLCYGHRHPSFFRSSKRWQPLTPLLMDHLLIQTTEISLEFIEGKLGLLAIEMLYEVCRVQNLSSAELRIFDDAYIDHLFDIVESTRSNEILNYSLIKFLVSLNEQFMVASVQNPSRDAKERTTTERLPKKNALTNRVLAILMRRLHSTKTFGENLIFMLNRADDSDEDLCVQLLILKMLYLLFTTPGAQEYFYTNDLRVLIDVFVRALNNLSEENESMRHTYLRVLHPLLNNTQLRTNPYKPLLVRHTLQSIISHAHIRDINPTTRRLVERCLSGQWCKAIPPSPMFDSSLSTTVDTDTAEVSPVRDHPVTAASKARSVADGELLQSTYLHPPGNGDKKHRPLVRSASAEILKPTVSVVETPLPDAALSRRPSKSRFRVGTSALNTGLSSPSIVTNHNNKLDSTDDSPTSLVSLAGAAADPRLSSRTISLSVPQRPLSHQRRPSRAMRPSRAEPQSPTASDSGYPLPVNTVAPRMAPLINPSNDTALIVNPPTAPLPASTSASVSGGSARTKGKSTPPPPPPKRRKPPQPTARGNGNGSTGETIQTIASSSPLNPNVQRARPAVQQRSS